MCNEKWKYETYEENENGNGGSWEENIPGENCKNSFFCAVYHKARFSISAEGKRIRRPNWQYCILAFLAVVLYPIWGLIEPNYMLGWTFYTFFCHFYHEDFHFAFRIFMVWFWVCASISVFTLFPFFTLIYLLYYLVMALFVFPCKYGRVPLVREAEPIKKE